MLQRLLQRKLLLRSLRQRKLKELLASLNRK